MGLISMSVASYTILSNLGLVKPAAIALTTSFFVGTGPLGAAVAIFVWSIS